MHKVIEEKHLQYVCKLNKKGSCRYIGTGTEGYFCFKTTIGKSMIDDRVEKGDTTNTGDNCEGYNIDNIFYVVRTDKGYIKTYTVDEKFFHMNAIVVREAEFTDEVGEAYQWKYADWDYKDKSGPRALMTSVGDLMSQVKFMELVYVENSEATGKFDVHTVITVNTILKEE